MKYFDFKYLTDNYQKIVVQELENESPKYPLVTICIQTYQHRKYIRQCLDSILMQKTSFPFEILLGEDNSNDGTREICLEYAKKFPDKIRLFLHHRENNISIDGSPTGRFNFLYNLFSAKGKYIAFCEGDDYWTDTLKLQKQIDFLENNNKYIIAYHDALIIDEQRKVVSSSYIQEYLNYSVSSIDIKKGPYIMLQTIVFRNVIQEFPLEILKVQGGDIFLISLLGNYGKGKYVDVSKSVYRKHTGGLWSTQDNFQKKITNLNTFRELSQYYSNLGEILIGESYQSKIQNIYSELLCQQLSYKQNRIVLKWALLQKKYSYILYYILYKLKLTLTAKLRKIGIFIRINEYMKFKI